jgi:hypothetical protein
MVLLMVLFIGMPVFLHSGDARVAARFEDFPQVRMCFTSNDRIRPENEPIVANSEGVR